MKTKYPHTLLASLLMSTLAASSFAEGLTPQVLVHFSGETGDVRGQRAENPPLLLNGKLFGATHGGGETFGLYSHLKSGVFYSLLPQSDAPAYQVIVMPKESGSAQTPLVINSEGRLFVGSRVAHLDGSTDVQGVSAVSELFATDTLSAASIALLPSLPASKIAGQPAADQDGNIYFAAGNSIYRTNSAGVTEAIIDFSRAELQKVKNNKTYYTKGRGLTSVLWSNADQALYAVTADAVTKTGGDPDALASGDPLGTLVKITKENLHPTGEIEVLHIFSSDTDGNPLGSDIGFTGIIEDGEWIYGSSTRTLWRINKNTPDSFHIVHEILVTYGTDGKDAYGLLAKAADGNIYGTTKLDYSTQTNRGVATGPGTIFRLNVGVNADRSDDALEFLHTFNKATEGGAPVGLSAGDIVITTDNEQVQRLFGATQSGGNNNFGTVYQLDVPLPAPVITGFTLVPTAVVVGDGQALNLSWETQGFFGDTCTISSNADEYPEVAAQVANGTLDLPAPTAANDGTITFTLACVSADQTKTLESKVELTLTAPASSSSSESSSSESSSSSSVADSSSAASSSSVNPTSSSAASSSAANSSAASSTKRSSSGGGAMGLWLLVLGLLPVWRKVQGRKR